MEMDAIELKKLRKRFPVQPHRLALRRADIGIQQSDIIDVLREYMFSDEWGDRKKVILNASSISSWETGKRTVPAKYITPLCNILDCTEGFLRGFTDDPHEDIMDPENMRSHKEVLVEKALIPPENLHLYDKQPVFVVSKKYRYPAGWAIWNNKDQRLIFYDKILTITGINRDDFDFYAMRPYFADETVIDERFPLSAKQIMKRDMVYVSMRTPDEGLRNEYNGWYEHNENKTGLINRGNGHVLPYTGINVSYFVYGNPV